MSKMGFTEKQKQAIFESGKNILVSAGAGSGKTAVLTERILEKLKQGISLEDLIVLTFTNAAAFEMKERVKKKIEEEIENGNTFLYKELSLIDNALICTFDSFALFLVKKYHYLLSMDSDIQIGDDILMNHEKRVYIEEIFDRKYEEKDPSFLTFIDTFSIKDDKKLKEVILSLYQKMDVLQNKKEFMENYFSYYHTPSKIERYVQEFEEKIKEEYQKILLFLEDMSSYITEETKNYYEKLCAIFYSVPKTFTYDDFLSLKNVKLPIFRTKEGLLYQEELRDIIDKMKDSYEKIKENLTYQSRNEIKEELASTKETITLLLDILKELDEKMWEFKFQNKIFTFSDITFLAITLLEENENIRTEIKEKTKEIMIDEYQDTNDINAYFISLLANDNLYMVGDVKQSIYGFRNANPSLFMEKYENYKEGKGGIKIDLTDNFRSKKEVLDAVNMIFERIMDLEIGGADYKNGHQMIAGNNTQKEEKEIDHQLQILDYSYIDSSYRKEEIEAFLIGYDIKKKIQEGYTIFDKDTQKQRRVTFSDFTILMDRKTDFILYKKILTYLNIPVYLNMEEGFIASDEIYVLKNILKLISCYQENNYYDSYFMHPFLSVARSFLFSYSDKDIFNAVLKAKKEDTTLYRAVLQMDVFSSFSSKMEAVSKKASTLCLSDLLYEIYVTFDCYHKMNTKENIELLASKFDYLLEVASHLEKMGYGLSEMITYFEDAIKYKMDTSFSVETKSNNSVMITNIHKSKGLEYPICYYSGLYKSFSKEEFKDTFLFHKEYGFIVPVFKEGIKETILKTLFKYDYLKKDKAEKIRLFYVALTRAREKMIFVCNLQDSKKESLEGEKVSNLIRLSYGSFYHILESIKEVLSSFIENVDLEKIGLTHSYRNGESAVSYDKIPKTEEVLSFIEVEAEKKEKEKKPFSSIHGLVDTEARVNMEMGTLLHEYLEIVDFKNLKQDFLNYDVPIFYQNVIYRLVTMPFFQNKILHTYKEYAFYDEKGKRQGIIDLLLETENAFIIIDYKLKEIEKDSYQKQVRGYMEYIEGITQKKVEGYLYSLLDGTYKEVKKKDVVHFSIL